MRWDIKVLSLENRDYHAIGREEDLADFNKPLVVPLDRHLVAHRRPSTSMD